MKQPLKRASNYLLAVSCVLLLAPLAAVAEDMPAGAWAGTWVASLTRSTFAGPAPKLDQVVIEPDSTQTIHVISSTGKETFWSYKPQIGEAVSIQGKEGVANSRAGVTVKAVKVNPYREEYTWNDHGRITHSFSTLSRDGKTQTYFAPVGPYRTVGTDKVVKCYGEVVVYEKQ